MNNGKGVGEVEWDGDVEMKSEETMSMMCWNVCGWWGMVEE